MDVRDGHLRIFDPNDNEGEIEFHRGDWFAAYIKSKPGVTFPFGSTLEFATQSPAMSPKDIQPQTRMVINEFGNVGIGITEPSQIRRSIGGCVCFNPLIQFFAPNLIGNFTPQCIGNKISALSFMNRQLITGNAHH